MRKLRLSTLYRLVGTSVAAFIVAGIAFNSQSVHLSVASAASTALVLAGGSTLAAPPYTGQQLQTGKTSVGAPGSILGYLASQSGAPNVQYCVSGSGQSKAIFVAGASAVNTACANAAGSLQKTAGFRPSNGTPNQVFPTLATTDVPLTQTEYSRYLSNHGNFEPVEIPAFVGSIAIIYHDIALGSSYPRLVLKDEQLCQIFSGTMKTFGQLLGTTDPTAIVPVYSSEGGTSFSFSNHLASAVTSISPSCTQFGVNENFAAADPGNIAKFGLAESDDAGVLGAVKSVNGAIGFVSAGYLTNNPNGVGEFNYARIVDGYATYGSDPFLSLPMAARYVNGSIQTDHSINQTKSGQGPATTSPLATVPYDSCVKTIAPLLYARPSLGYPILAVTYLLFNNISGDQTAPLQMLVKTLNNPRNFKRPGVATPITTVDYSYLQSSSTGYVNISPGYNSLLIATSNRCLQATFSTPYPSPTPVPTLPPATPTPVPITPTPSPTPSYLTSPSPLPSPSVAPTTPPPVRDTIVVNGQSADVSGKTKCPTGNDPPANQYYIAPFNEGSTSQSYAVIVSPPTTAEVALSFSVSSSYGLEFNLYSPSGVTLYSTTSAPGATTSYSYFAGDAVGGSYSLEISGGAAATGGCDGFGDPGTVIISSSTSVATWSGTATYTP